MRNKHLIIAPIVAVLVGLYALTLTLTGPSTGTQQAAAQATTSTTATATSSATPTDKPDPAPEPAPAEQVGPSHEEDPHAQSGVLGKQILEDLRAKAKPGEDNFRAPYNAHEQQVLEEEWLKWLRAHSDDPNVKAMAKTMDLKNGKQLADWLEDDDNAYLDPVGEDGLKVQNHYFKDGKVVKWKVQTFPQDELVWFQRVKGTDRPIFKFVCGNPLTPAPKPKPKPTETTTTPAPTTTKKTTPPPATKSQEPSRDDSNDDKDQSQSDSSGSTSGDAQDNGSSGTTANPTSQAPSGNRSNNQSSGTTTGSGTTTTEPVPTATPAPPATIVTDQGLNDEESPFGNGNASAGPTTSAVPTTAP